MIQAVTSWFPSWRSLSPLKGHLTIPKRSLWITRHLSSKKATNHNSKTPTSRGLRSDSVLQWRAADVPAFVVGFFFGKHPGFFAPKAWAWSLWTALRGWKENQKKHQTPWRRKKHIVPLRSFPENWVTFRKFWRDKGPIGMDFGMDFLNFLEACKSHKTSAEHHTFGFLSGSNVDKFHWFWVKIMGI